MTDVAPEQMQLLYDVSRSLHSLMDLKQLLARVVDQTKELLDAEGCSVVRSGRSGRCGRPDGPSKRNI
ncbi:hypothetical protein L6Q96_07320 [Candidatus Binatia bacterium]|nr:hypothetical protein [Candidatus Binatia bacterium]